MQWNLSQSWRRLPQEFYSLVDPAVWKAPELVLFNDELAQDLGLGAFSSEDLAVLSAQRSPTGAPFTAQAYAGHQFGHFNILGDGRAALLGEIQDPRGGTWDLQFKGSGPTAYARRGDGRAALGPMLREYLVSEAFAALGIPTTRTLSVVRTGDWIQRTWPEPGAVMLRAAASHIRVGTFEYAAALGSESHLQALLDYTLQRHYPEYLGLPDAPARFLDAAAQRQIQLTAQWMAVGFIHGVLNTDNIAVSGQGMDFGPCGFLDQFRWDQVFSSIDTQGRYAYGRQGSLILWNLARLAETLLPLWPLPAPQAEAQAQDLLHQAQARMNQEFLKALGRKFGLESASEEDAGLCEEFLNWLEESRGDFTLGFTDLQDSLQGQESPRPRPPASWVQAWHQRLETEPSPLQTMQRANPRVIPRNGHLHRALLPAEAGDLEPFYTLLQAVKSPFQVPQDHPELLEAPADTPEPFITTCGT